MPALRNALQRTEHIWRLYRWWLMPWRYLRFRRWCQRQNHSVPANRPIVVFDFANARVDGPQGRRFYALFIAFVRAGYHPVFVARYLFLVSIDEKIKKFCLREEFSVVSALEDVKAAYVHVSDRAQTPVSDTCERRVVVDYRYDYPHDREGFPFPFPMFPGVYASGADQQVAALRAHARRWQVFFGGSFRAERYSMSAISSVYGKLPRATALAALKQQMPARWVEPVAQNEWEQAAVREQTGILVLNTLNVRVDTAQWLELMATARFFLALPGVSYPMSHNLVEALAVGTIPITEYPELFFPALQDGVNCLTYHGEQGFIDAVRRALQMSEPEREELAQGAVAYYENYLSPKATVCRLLAEPNDPVVLRQTPFILSGGRDL